MTVPSDGSGPPSPLSWLVEAALDRSRRVSILLAVAYVSGVSGLVIGLSGGTAGSTDPHVTVGVALLALSFLCLFAGSLTILSVTGQPVSGRRR